MLAGLAGVGFGGLALLAGKGKNGREVKGGDSGWSDERMSGSGSVEH